LEIYQVHQIGGEYEDYYDYIVGTYLHMEDAEKYKQKLLDKQQERIRRNDFCEKCPINKMTKRKWDNSKKKVLDYCKNSKIEYNNNEVWCENKYFGEYYGLVEVYEIERVDVIE
jgi:hypothetical protein